MHFRFKPRRNPGSQSQHRSVNRTAVTSQLELFRDAMDEQNKATAELAKRILALDKAFHGLKSVRNQDAKILSDLEQRTSEMRNYLGESRKQNVA